MMMSMMPSQKIGIAWPATASMVQAVSTNEWRLSAARIPSGSAIASATASPAVVR
jgi:hypothetical protein